MSFTRSRKYSESLCPPSRSAGIALVSVLWLLLLLSGLAATVAYIARIEALLARHSFDLAQAQAAADAAIVDTISRISDERPGRGAPRDAHQSWEFEGIPVTIAVSNEAGRIDVNTTGDELLLAFLQAEGATASTASGLLEQLRSWQTQGDRLAAASRSNAVVDSSAGATPLEITEELRNVPGWGEQNLNCWLDALTVYSGQPSVSISDAAPGALAAVRWLHTHNTDRSREPIAASSVNPPGAHFAPGEVLRIRASATVSDVIAVSEWIGRLTGDVRRPALTMRWDQGHPSESTAHVEMHCSDL